MNERNIINIVDDRLEKRFESYAQAQIKLHKDYHEKLLNSVDEKLDFNIEKSIGKYVNGKIDKLQKTVDERLQPYDDTRKWFTSFKQGSAWLAGFVTPWAIIGSAIIWFVHQIQK